MRRTNFVTPERTRPGLVATVVWLVSAALFLLAGWAFLEARKLNAEADRLQGHALRLGQELDRMALTDGTVPTEAEFAELVERIEQLNTLSGPRHASLPVLLEALEEALPSGVWVGQINYSVETGIFAVSLQGENETALPAALRRIEEVPKLVDVILERQIRVQSGARNLLQYDIRARAE